MFRLNKKIILFIILIFSMISTANSALEWQININEEDFASCYPSFKSTVWSNCTDNLQNRTLIDLNSCMEDRVEIRSCDLANDEISNMLINSKSIEMEKISEDPIYSGQASGYNYGYIFIPDPKPQDSAFIFKDTNNFNLYFGRLVETIDGVEHYLIKEVEESELDLLVSYGFMKNTDLEELTDEAVYNRYRGVYFILGILAFVLIVLIIVFLFRKKHKSNGSNFKTVINKDGEEETTIKKESLFSSSFSSEPSDSKKEKSKPIEKADTNLSISNIKLDNKIQEKKDIKETKIDNSSVEEKDITVVTNYIQRNSYLPKPKLKENLKKVGWSEKIIDEAFKRVK